RNSQHNEHCPPPRQHNVNDSRSDVTCHNPEQQCSSQCALAQFSLGGCYCCKARNCCHVEDDECNQSCNCCACKGNHLFDIGNARGIFGNDRSKTRRKCRK